MKHYVLVKDNEIIQHYTADTKPAIAATKGTVYEYVAATAPVPTEAQKVVESHAVVAGKYVQSFALVNKTPAELWHYPDYAKRIIAPVSLIFEATGLAMKAWFDLNEMPVKKVGDQVHLYCNVILPEHQAIVDGLAGVITIEDKP